FPWNLLAPSPTSLWAYHVRWPDARERFPQAFPTPFAHHGADAALTQPPLGIARAWSSPHSAATRPDIAGLPRGADAATAPRPARSAEPSAGSTPDAATTPAHRAGPTRTAADAATTCSRTTPASSARAGCPSTPGTPPSPAAASGPGTRPPAGTGRTRSPAQP